MALLKSFSISALILPAHLAVPTNNSVDLTASVNQEPLGIRSSFAGPRLPASGTVADLLISDGRQHCIDQRRAILWAGSFDLRSEGGQSLLGSFEAYLARRDIVFVGVRSKY